MMSDGFYDVDTDGGFPEPPPEANVYRDVSMGVMRGRKNEIEQQFLAKAGPALKRGDIDTVREALDEWADDYDKVLHYLEENR